MKFVSTLFITAIVLFSCAAKPDKINRHALVERNSPIITAFDSLASLSVGNGDFAFTVDATGLQTFPELYRNGVPLGTMSSWGWHSFPNTENFRHEETLKNYPYHNNPELYACQFKDRSRAQSAANYFRENPHRLHLGYVGFEFETQPYIKNINQKLDLWNGIINSRFDCESQKVEIKTAVNPSRSEIAVSVKSKLLTNGKLKINLRFPFPTKGHSDDASNFNVPQKHQSELIYPEGDGYIIKRTIDTTVYYTKINFKGNAKLTKKENHYFVLTTQSEEFEFTVEFAEKKDFHQQCNTTEVFADAAAYWQKFWQQGAAVDFTRCTDPRAKELERRVLLSQYLMAINSAGMYPPQETGLTYNSWFGKFHLEMHWWHAAWLPLWNHADLLEPSLQWYSAALPVARQIAARQGFQGIRWMKMTDPQAMEAPSNVGSFLIWQQPHIIYFAEQMYRNNPSQKTIAEYKNLVEQTALFMADFCTYDTLNGRYTLNGIIAAQETLRASETVNPPFELSQWHFALSVAQKWRERAGEPRNPKWDDIIDNLSVLAHKDSLYLASENALDTYTNIRFTSDHPAVLGALGIFPENRMMEQNIMKNTLSWIWDNWNWDETWGWDYPMVAMCAARLGEPQKAVAALLMDKCTNTYLPNGHNYQDKRLRVYLPGNGGLLTAVAMMCAGWDGCADNNPGFPKDGTWNVRWEGLAKMP